MKKSSRVTKEKRISKTSANEPQVLPPYLGLGRLHTNSVSVKAGKTVAKYMRGEEVIYKVEMGKKSSRVTEYFDGEELAESRHETLEKAFLQHMMAMTPDENPRFERLSQQITENRNIYVQFASEACVAYFPASYIFSLKQPIVSTNRAKWSVLKKKMESEKDSAVMHLESEQEGAILRLLDSGKVTVENVAIGTYSTILLNLAAATDVLWQSNVVPTEKEYRLMAIDSSMDIQGGLQIYLGVPDRGFVTYSVINADDMDMFGGMDKLTGFFSEQSRQFLASLKSSSVEKETKSRPGKTAAAIKKSLRTGTSTDWNRFTKELVVTLGCLEENEYLIISIPSTNRYVQFAAQGSSGMRIEATSNEYLPEDKQLDEKSQRRMLELGWQTPTHWPEEDNNEPEGSPNYYLEVAPPVPLAYMAELAVKTLRDVFDIQHPEALQYNAFTESGEPIKFPNLGIEPDPVIELKHEMWMWSENGPSNPSITIVSIKNFDARGMRRVYGRGDYFGRNGYHMDIWKDRKGRLLARFWSRCCDFEERSYEIIGMPLSMVPEPGSDIGNGDWVPDLLRDEYARYVITPYK